MICIWERLADTIWILKIWRKKIKEEKIRLILLCSPHNPVGRVWTVEELATLGNLCVRYGVTVVSDEIHHDFIFLGEHHVFASLKSM